MLVFSTCLKKPGMPDFSNKIEFGITKADTVLYFRANFSSEISQTEGNEIINYGHCWSTNKNPSVDNNKTSFGKLNKPVTFKSEIENLSDNTTYYIRPYVTCLYETIYGDEQSIKTLKTGKPHVTTTDITNITATTAFCDGTNDDGGYTITQRGFCWNTTSNPTLENNLGYTTNGNGTGDFTSQITELTENTTYYISAYATNEKGTSYGQTESFKTKHGFIDKRDGQEYKVVDIGNQTWMAENLNYQTDNSWWYDNDSANGEIYGRLYTWNDALTACPQGWHLPTDDEWKTLEIQLGMSQSEADEYNWRGTDEGNKLKSTNGWYNNGNGTNLSGFNALPGGERASGWTHFNNIKQDGTWWASTEWGYDGFVRNLFYSFSGIYRSGELKVNAYSVRCVKD